MEEICCRKKINPRSPTDKKKIINRLNRLSGQLNGVKKMIEEDRYCDEVLIQLSAIDKAIKSLANTLLDEHMHSCLVKQILDGKYDAIDEITDLFKRFQ